MKFLKGLLDLKPHFSVSVEFLDEGVHLTLKDSRKEVVSLPLGVRKRIELGKWHPKMSRAIHDLESAVMEKGDEQGIDSEFPIDRLAETDKSAPDCSLHKGGVLLSYRYVSEIRMQDENPSSLSRDNLTDLGIPDFARLKVNLTSEGIYRESDFQFKLEISTLTGDKVRDWRLAGHVLIDSGGAVYFLNPLVKNLVDKFISHQSVRRLTQYKRSFETRVRDFSQVRAAAIEAKAGMDDLVISEEIMYLDDLPYEIDQTLDGELVAVPRMPAAQMEDDQVFEAAISSIDDIANVTQLNLKENDGLSETRKRVFLSDQARQMVKLIREFNSSAPEQRAKWAQDPKNYFGHLPRQILGDTFSDRVVGFVIGKGLSKRDVSSSGTEWGAGFEQDTILLRTENSSTIRMGYSPTPLEYVEMKRNLLDFKASAESAEKKFREENELHFTPLPRTVECESIRVESLKCSFSSLELERFLKLVETTNIPVVTSDEIDQAKAAIRASEESNQLVVEWSKDDGRESIKIPLASLQRAIPTEKVVSEERVSIDIGDASKLMGNPPSWDWREVDMTDFAQAPGFRAGVELWSHQRRGYAWLRWLYSHDLGVASGDRDNSHKGALLADDMGLGKTIQVIAMISYLKSLAKVKDRPILIIAPLGLIKTSWIKDGFDTFLGNFSELEIHDFSDCPFRPDLIMSKQEAERINTELSENKKSISDCYIDNGIKSEIDKVVRWCEGKILLTSYETARNRGIALAGVDFSLIVLDEAQKIKNSGSLQSNVVKALKSEMVIAMTGTPIENSLMDLWSIMDFVLPNHLGESSIFKDRFIKKIKEAGLNTEVRREAREELEKALAPVWLRRTKSEIYKDSKDLPEIVHHDNSNTGDESKNKHAVPMSARQEELYSHYALLYKNSGLVALRGMLSACAAPWLAEPIEFIWDNKKELFTLCPKLEITIDILDKIRLNSDSDGKKVIVFANTRAIQGDLAYFISDWATKTTGVRLEVEVYNGKAPAIKREKMLERFRSAVGFKVIIISPRAGGVGLNLTDANHVIHYTREWNPALERQATDRVYRLKQTRTVHVYYPTSLGRDPERPSAEERLADLLREKRDLMDDFTISSEENSIEQEFHRRISSVRYEGDQIIESHMISSLNPRDFEAYVACVLEKALNFETYVIGQANDKGVDVIAFGKDRNLLVQVKHSSVGRDAGSKSIQEIRGAKSHYEHMSNQLFDLAAVTNTNFSIGATNLSIQGQSVELYAGPELSELTTKIEIKMSDIKNKLDFSARFKLGAQVG